MAFFQTDNLWVKQLADDVAELGLDVAGRPVNVFTRQVLADLDAALDRVAAEPRFQLLLIRSGKQGNFLAGADLHEFASVKTAEDAFTLSALGQRTFDKLEALPVPTMAVISGACLGGGLEFALACDYRVVIDQPKTQLGLPEIELGLLPAWGGTQRLPRVVGLERALQIILGGRRLKAADALRWGLADRLAAEGDEPPEFLARPGKRPKKGLPLLTWRQSFLESNRLGRSLIFRGTERLLKRKLPDDMPAPWEALAAIRAGIDQGMEAGLAREREAAGRLANSPACHNLIRLFFQREEARKQSAEARREGPPPIRRVGVVGAGVMGAGIAQLSALHGCEVVVQEVDESALGQGIMRLFALFNKAVERGILSAADMPKRLNAVHGTTTWKGFADLDVVVEAVVENLEVKRKVFRQMEEHTSPSTILATNTSSLRVEDLQEGLKRPERVAGLHFFNPVHKMPLVEVVRAPATSEQVVSDLLDWSARLGKTPVLVKDSPGFVVNRVLMPYLNEAVLLVSEGVRVELVDKAMVRFGMPVGPLDLLDQVGLDVAAHIADDLGKGFRDRFGANPAFGLMTQHGWLGLKSGTGFYHHRRGRKSVNRAAEGLLRAQSFPAAPPAELMAAASERMVLLMVNEAAACLGEGLVESADTLDLAMVLGTGWAPHRGGPLRYARDIGLENVLGSLTELARTHGPRFEPCAELRRMCSDMSQPSL